MGEDIVGQSGVDKGAAVPVVTANRLRLDVGSTRSLTVLAAIVGGILLGFAVGNLTLGDMDAYWNAAQRLRAGDPLYVSGELHASDTYRYAPWFAVAWIPLTFLPYPLVQAAWFAGLLTASLTTGWLAWRNGGRALVLICTPLLIWTACYGNVHPLLMLALVWGVERRSGPVWIALAGSLKAAPILLVLVYLGRREWTRAAVCLAVFGGLVAPMLFLPGYQSNPGLTLSLYGWAPALYLIVALFSCAVAFLRPTWMAGAVAVIASLPRLLLYDLSFALIGSTPPRSRPSARSGHR